MPSADRRLRPTFSPPLRGSLAFTGTPAVVNGVAASMSSGAGCCWFRPSSASGGVLFYAAEEDGEGGWTSYRGFQLSATHVQYLDPVGNAVNIAPYAAGQWVFIAWTKNPAATFIVVSADGTASRVVDDTANLPNGSIALNGTPPGSASGIKLWGASSSSGSVPTAADLIRESEQRAPFFRENLIAYCPYDGLNDWTETGDRSGLVSSAAYPTNTSFSPYIPPVPEYASPRRPRYLSAAPSTSYADGTPASATWSATTPSVRASASGTSASAAWSAAPPGALVSVDGMPAAAAYAVPAASPRIAADGTPASATWTALDGEGVVTSATTADGTPAAAAWSAPSASVAALPAGEPASSSYAALGAAVRASAVATSAAATWAAAAAVALVAAHGQPATASWSARDATAEARADAAPAACVWSALDGIGEVVPRLVDGEPATAAWTCTPGVALVAASGAAAVGSWTARDAAGIQTADATPATCTWSAPDATCELAEHTVARFRSRAALLTRWRTTHAPLTKWRTRTS